MDILAGLAAGAASGATSSVLGYFGNKQQQEYYKENQQKAFELGQREQLNRARNARTGLLLAGMSPALAQDGKFAPASAPSVPLGSSSFPDINMAQSMLAISEARKAEAEANKTNTEVTNMQDENLTAQLNLQRMYEKLAADAAARGNKEDELFFNEMKNEIGSAGALRGLAQFIDMSDKAEWYDLHKFIFRVDKAVAETQMRTYGKGAGVDIINDIARMPSSQRTELNETINMLRKKIEIMGVEKEIAEKDLELTESEISQIKSATEHLQNMDIKMLIDKGDYKGAGIALLCLILEAFAGSGGRMLPTTSRSRSRSTSEVTVHK